MAVAYTMLLVITYSVPGAKVTQDENFKNIGGIRNFDIVFWCRQFKQCNKITQRYKIFINAKLSQTSNIVFFTYRCRRVFRSDRWVIFDPGYRVGYNQ